MVSIGSGLRFDDIGGKRADRFSVESVVHCLAICTDSNRRHR
jgi:hypothetical protein